MRMLNFLRPLIVPLARHRLIARPAAGLPAGNLPAADLCAPDPQTDAASVPRGVHVAQRINHLMKALGMPALVFDGHGCARLLFDNQLVVNFESDAVSGLLHVYADLGRLPANGCEALYRRLLEANLFGAKTGGATLAVDASQNQAVLSCSLHVTALSPAALSQALAAFVQTAHRWRGALGHGQSVDEASARHSPLPAAT